MLCPPIPLHVCSGSGPPTFRIKIPFPLPPSSLFPLYDNHGGCSGALTFEFGSQLKHSMYE